MKCAYCGITWTLRADGVEANRQRSERLRLIGVVLYMFGLSYRHAASFLGMLEWQASKSGVERDVAEAGQAAQGYHEGAPKVRVRVLGVDGTGAAMAGRQAGMVFFVDVERGKLLCVEPLQETDAHRVRQHVARVMAHVGAEELRTDEQGEARARAFIATYEIRAGAGENAAVRTVELPAGGAVVDLELP